MGQATRALPSDPPANAADCIPRRFLAKASARPLLRVLEMYYTVFYFVSS